MPVSIRSGLLIVMAVLVPAAADAGLLAPFHCGSCGPRPWIGFTCAMPLPRPCPLRHGCGLLSHRGCGYSARRCCGPAFRPPINYGCGPVQAPCGCGNSFAPPIMTTPSFTPPTNIGPVLPAPVSCAPRPFMQPVCQTTLRPRQVTTYRNVPTTQYRREAYVQNVPVTTYQQITVPRTVYQPQTRYRNVAYTVNRQVAQTHTQYIPQTQVGYVPQMPMAAAPCSTCPQNMAFGLTPHFASPAYPSGIATLPMMPYGGPVTGAVPTPIALPQSAGAPQIPAATLHPPRQSSSANTWQTIPQRHAQQPTGIQQMGAWLPSYAPQPTQPARSLFQPAPSAANVWQSRWLR